MSVPDLDKKTISHLSQSSHQINSYLKKMQNEAVCTSEYVEGVMWNNQCVEIFNENKA